MLTLHSRRKITAPKAQGAGYDRVIKGYIHQPHPEILQYGIRPAVKGIMEHILVAVIEHGPAGFVRYREKIHDIDEGGQQGGHVLPKLHCCGTVQKQEDNGERKDGQHCDQAVVHRAPGSCSSVSWQKTGC